MPNPFGDTPLDQKKPANPFGDTPLTGDDKTRVDQGLLTPDIEKVQIPASDYSAGKLGDVTSTTGYQVKAQPTKEYDFNPITPNDPGFGEPNLNDPSVGPGVPPIPARNSRETSAKQFAEIKDANKFAAQDHLGARVNLDKSLNDTLLSADLARSDKIEERIQKVSAKYPGATVRLAPQSDGDRLFIKLPDAKEYIPVEPVGIFDDTKDYGAKAGKVAGNLVNAENLATTGAALTTEGMAMPARMAVSGISGAIGRFIDQGVEFLRGYNKEFKEDPVGTGQDLAASAATNAAGEGLGSLVQGTRNLKRGLANKASFTSDAVDAAKRVTFPDGQGGMQEFPISADMIFPQMRRMMNQFEQLGFSGAVNQRQGQKEAILYGLDKIKREGTLAGQDFLESGNLNKLSGNLENRVYQESGVTNPGIGHEEAGKNILSSLTAYKNVGKKQIGQVYNGLFGNMPQGSQIDLSQVQANIAEGLKPLKFEGKPIKKEVDIGTGTPLIQEEPTEVVFNKGISGELKGVLKQIQDIKTGVAEHEGASAFERIKKLREIIADHAFPSDNTVVTASADQQVARKVYSDLTDALENVQFPQGTDPSFIKAWQEANRTNRMFNEFFEQKHIKEVMGYSEPTQVLQKLRPGNTAFIRDLKTSMPEDDFKQNVQGVFHTDLYNNPAKINSTFDSFKGEPEILDMLVPKNEQTAWRNLGNQWQKMQSSKVYNWMKTYGTMAERASELAQTSPEELARYIETDHSGMFKKVTGMAFASNAIEDAVTYEGGKRLLNPKKALANLNNLDTHGFLNTKYMTVENLDKIKDFRTLLSGMAGSGQDSGASLEAASDIASLTDVTRLFHSPGEYVGDAARLWTKSQLATAITSDTAQHIMKTLGGGKTGLVPIEMPKTRAAITAGMNFLQDISLDADDKSQTKPVFDITKYPDLSLDDLQTLQGIYTIPESAFKKAQQNQNLMDMEKELQKTKNPDIQGGSGQSNIDGSSVFDALDLPDEQSQYASLDKSGKFQALSEQDKLRYMEEDAKDKGPTKLAPLPDAHKPIQKPKTQLATPIQAPDDKEQLKDLLSKMSTTIGVKPKLLEKIANVESHLGDNTQAKTSSARGLFQFTAGTWKEMVKKYGKRTGITYADIDDTHANAVMGALHLYENSKSLKNYTGRNPTDAELYASHFLGLSGAKQLIDNYKANPKANSVFPEAAKANPTIFYNGGKPRTIRQVYHLLQAKVD